MSQAQFRKYKSPKRKGDSEQHERQPSGWLMVLRPWLPVFLVVLVLAAAVQGWQWMQLPTSMPFTEIKVVASYKHISRRQLQQAIKAEVNAGFFALDVPLLKQRLQQSLPWIESVVVRRVWPSTLKLRIVEQTPVASWNHRQLINRHGDLFQPSQDSMPQNLPSLNGPAAGFAAVLAEYRLIQQRLQPLNLSVQKLTMTDRQAWHLQLSNGVVVLLGKDRVNQRLMRFVKAYPELLAMHPGEIASVDLRYPNGFAVK